jgi:hypothetical protein
MKIEPSTRNGKKWMVEYKGKKIHFGASGMSDYTIHKDPKRKKAYLLRHQKNENWNDPTTAGFWSRWILWNSPTSKEDNMKKVHRLFNL